MHNAQKDQAMNEASKAVIAKELGLRPAQVAAAAELMEGGATVPFVARYRKEATGGMDEVALAAVRDRLAELTELTKRREAILASLSERDLLTPALDKAVREAKDKTTLEDVYLPYRQKRQTRAEKARQRGLAPLAELIMSQRGVKPREAAAKFVDPGKDVQDVETALAGARDIIAESISEDAGIRTAMRALFSRRGRFACRLVKGKEKEGAAYRDWFDWEEPLSRIAGHRALAMFRGERENILSLSLRPPEDEALELLGRKVLRSRGADGAQVEEAVRDGYKRLLGPSLETETRAALKKKADEEAISVFSKNLREVLLAPPLGAKRLLALDPGIRTGAKLVVLDERGTLAHHGVVFPMGSQRQKEEAAATLAGLCRKYAVEAVGVGNGTAGRETEAFVKSLNLGIPVIAVNESGASIYSASDVARREFPDLDLTVRGAVSIGRRLMDPLAELVKLDPKSIGVGQYQHDVDQAALKRALSDVVESCVNAVGVDVNMASPELLTHVSGLGPVLAANIVAWREENGAFRSRRDLKKVKRLGPAAFEQAAGFLRIKGDNPLDASAVHPERYALVERMAKDAGRRPADLLADESARGSIRIEDYVSDKVGLPTLTDIMDELAKPGRDPRPAFSVFSFAEHVSDISDLRPGMRLPGIVTNVTAFGAFVDVGAHRDGLVHVSQLADRYVSDPSQVTAPGREVMVTVTAVDMERGRISLSMKSAGGAGG
jgi:protein Tex